MASARNCVSPALKKFPPRWRERCLFYGLDLINGYWKTEELWRRYARVKKACLLYDGRPLCVATFADSRRWQHLSFPDIVVSLGDSMKLEILEIYPWEKGAGAAITEIVLQLAR